MLDYPISERIAYTILRNRAHLNIDFMSLEQGELVPAEDKGIEGFMSSVKALSVAESWKTFLDRYGSRRADPLFWST